MRAFFIGLLSVWAVCFGLPLVFALDGSVQPLDGDLTRIGGLSERDYGWTEPQLRFDRLTTARFGSIAALARAGVGYDFLVIGDSFSEAGVGNPHRFGYQQWIEAGLGYSVATISQAQIDYERVVCDLAALPTPPRYVVYQTAERYLAPRIRNLESAAKETAPCPRPVEHSHRWAPKSVPALEPYVRSTAVGWHTIYAAFFSRMAAMLSNATGYSRNSVKVFKLSNGALFSNLRSDDLLVVNEDLDSQVLDVDRLRHAIHGLAGLLARESGSTFILLVSPNKLSAYHRYVIGRAPEPTSPVLRGSGVPMADVDMELLSLITRGHRDVYLPDDTHWGYRGHCAAARAIASYIRLEWRFRTCDQ